ncbi:MAG: orotidine-5'-phosphate decarboxylase [candidate division WOR-3 bacterium]|nr:orotidine-5'-phosphate decarboxylase [candidate division WOR-3 bacterium]
MRGKCGGKCGTLPVLQSDVKARQEEVVELVEMRLKSHKDLPLRQAREGSHPVTFVDRLVSGVLAKRSHVVVGLDPVYEDIPAPVRRRYAKTLRGASLASAEFNFRIIDAVCDIVPAIKPQIAFYERYGIEGIKAFLQTVIYGKKKGLVVIEDAKRSDIGSTAAAYSQGHIGRVSIAGRSFSPIDVDAMTVNAYLGSDGVLPFVEDVVNHGKGIFVLVKTSNPTSIEIQDVTVVVRGKRLKLYEVMAHLVDNWGRRAMGDCGYSSVGAVVGATFPEEAKKLRELMPRAYFLVPGFGAQGGTAADVVGCFNSDGLGALVSASRSVIYAYKRTPGLAGQRFADAARAAIVTMNEDVNGVLARDKKLLWQR